MPKQFKMLKKGGGGDDAQTPAEFSLSNYNQIVRIQKQLGFNPMGWVHKKFRHLRYDVDRCLQASKLPESDCDNEQGECRILSQPEDGGGKRRRSRKRRKSRKKKRKSKRRKSRKSKKTRRRRRRRRK